MTDGQPIRSWRIATLGLLILAGCTVTRTVIDRIRVEPLSPSPYHRQLTDKEQCMHCHAALASAPAVPHPQYKRCTSCHKVD